MRDNTLQVRLSGLRDDVAKLKKYLLENFQRDIKSVSDEVPNRWDKGVRLYILLELNNKQIEGGA